MGVIWKDRKRIAFALPWTFTRYSLTEEKLVIDKGFLNRSEEEVRLYRILDVSLKRTLGQRLFGLGTIHCCSADKSSPEFDIKNIVDSANVKNKLSDLIEKNREKKRVAPREYMQAEGDTDDDPELSQQN